MESLGALGPNLVLAHAVAVTDEEIEILARRQANVAFCPGASLKLAKGATVIGRYPEMQEAGITVGLGTDGVSASGNLNLMRQMYVVAGLFKDARMDPRGRQHFWITPVPLEPPEEGTDRWAVEQGWISLTPLRLDLTDEGALKRAQAD